jgi:alginate O-acetyltransferase complex protein AlgI
VVAVSLMNFNSPYRATSIIEFWRRWHMTLSRFLRDYIYLPLGGNRKGTARRHANLMIVMLVGGLWHGAAWTFVAWGALHGLYLMVNHGWHWVRARMGWTRGRVSRPAAVAAWALTMLAVMVAWIFFRAKGWDAAWVMMEGISGRAGLTLPESYLARLGAAGPWLAELGVVFGAGRDATIFPALHELATVVAVAMVAVALPNTQEWLSRWRPSLDWAGGPVSWPASVVGWRPGAWMGAATAVAAMAGLIAVARANDNAFIYFQF